MSHVMEVCHNMNVCHDMKCYSSYLAKDRIKTQMFNVSPKILPNEIHVFIDDQNSSSSSISKY